MPGSEGRGRLWRLSRILNTSYIEMDARDIGCDGVREEVEHALMSSLFRMRTYGALDWGGASAQYTLEVRPAKSDTGQTWNSRPHNRRSFFFLGFPADFPWKKRG